MLVGGETQKFVIKQLDKCQITTANDNEATFEVFYVKVVLGCIIVNSSLKLNITTRDSSFGYQPFCFLVKTQKMYVG